MSALLAGIDFSSKAIHVALVPLDEDDHDTPPVTLRCFEFVSFKTGATTPAYRSVERCRMVRGAMRELLSGFGPVTHWAKRADSPLGRVWVAEHEVAHVCVEEPFGASRKADNVMRELYGAILASIPTHIERDTITTHEWRDIVFGGPLPLPYCTWKDYAIEVAQDTTSRVMNEHEAEAYLIARAARTRLHQAVAS